MPDPDVAPRIARATPSKAFFIDMLTRDIGIADAILDLVDNAIDKAVKVEDLDVTLWLQGETTPPVVGRRISVTLSAEAFAIEDTCGGITLDEAQNNVFLFGNP